MLQMTLEELKAIAASDDTLRYIPVYKEIFADMCTPVEVLRILKGASKHAFMLESAEAQKCYGRYSFLGYDPIMEVTARDGQVRIDGELQKESDPAYYLRLVLQAYKAPRLEQLPCFSGGLVGYFSYDYLKYSEPCLKLDGKDDEGFNDVDLMLFDKVIVFDNLCQKVLLIKQIPVEDMDAAYDAADVELDEVARLITEGEPVKETSGHITGEFNYLFDEEAYAGIVRKAQEHIKEGDIFQVVLSNRIDAPFEGSLIDTYRFLRSSNPSPYMFYFASDDIELAGASPETLVKLEDGVLHTFPLAGTRPRGATPEEDAAMEAELLADEKELAEHNMLVDLGRNDIGRIARIGSVEVETLHQICRFSHVMHIGSTVRGELADDCDALDAVDSVLPAGTLSGAPKIRACQIINDLEDCKRGVYGGAVGYIDLAGNLDTCIAIRLTFKKNGRVFVRSGAGIVADSDPIKEHRECINKAAAVMEALTAGKEGMR